MEGLPRVVVDLVCSAALERSAPAFVRVDARGLVVEAGGALDRFGLSARDVGVEAAARLGVLGALLPAGPEPLCVPLVELAPEVYADVHVLGDDGAAWVVLVDRSAWAAERRVAQQLANDMSLLRDELSRRAAAPAAPSWSERYDVDEAGERRFASVLTALLGGLARAGDDVPPRVAVRDAGLFARALTRAVVDEAGAVHALAGERFTAVFGVLPTSASPASCAVAAAERMVEAVDELNAARRRDGSPEISLAVGIASGDASFGALGGLARPRLGTIGASVERSPRLAEAARPSSVLVDAETYGAIGDARARFVPVERVGDVAAYRREGR